MANPAQLKFNDPAPDIKLLDVMGNPVQLSSLWKDAVLVLAFTRHFGCPQCKDMVDQLIEAHPALTEKGLRLAIVNHASPADTKAFYEKRDTSAICLADPDRTAYRAYGLYQGRFWQTWFSPRVWASNKELAKTKGYKVEVPPAGQDALQMSGTFIVGMDGRIRMPYYYEDIADHPPVDLILHGIMGADWKRPFDSKPLA